jgi:hypothetical protein
MKRTVSVQASHLAQVQEKLPHEHGASHCSHNTSRRGVLRDCCSELCLEVVTCSASDLPPQPLILAFSFLISRRGLRSGPTNCVRGRSYFNSLLSMFSYCHLHGALEDCITLFEAVCSAVVLIELS